MAVLFIPLVTTTPVSVTAEAVTPAPAMVINPPAHYFTLEAQYPVYVGAPIVIPIADAVRDASVLADNNRGYTDGEVVLLYADETVALLINVPQDGTYFLHFDYFLLTDSMLNAELSISVNGVYPFTELRSVVLPDLWTTDYSELSFDRFGNEIPRPSDRYMGWLGSFIHDSTFRVTDPLGIPLRAGANEIVIRNFERPMLLGNITLHGQQPLPSFVYRGGAVGNNAIILWAQQPDSRNDLAIRPSGEFNLRIEPVNARNRSMNFLDGHAFREGGQRVNYTFVVEEAGYYYIGFNYRQARKSESVVFRDILINNEIVYQEFQSVPFTFSREFTRSSVRNADGQRVSVFLEAGTHEISLVVTLREVSESIIIFERIIREINELAIDVRRLTGSGETDRHRDFLVQDFIPDIEDRLLRWANEIREQHDRLSALSGRARASEYSGLLVAERSLRSLAQDPDRIPGNINLLNDDTNSARGLLASALNNLYFQDLDIDRIFIYQADAYLGTVPGFFRRLWFSIQRFFISFFLDDFNRTTRDSDEVLVVWVNRSRQFVEIMQRMVDEQFTPQTGIEVQLSIMPDPGRLVLARAAGTEPDIAASIGMGSVFDLAVRGALWDFREAENFQEVAQRFPPALFIPSVVGDGIFGIPETFDFLVTYYRTDILESHGLTPPDTWTDVHEMLPHLQRRGMNFATHFSQFTMGIKPINSMLPFFYQHGADIFGDNMLDIQLDSEEALRAMDEVVRLFTVFNAPFEVGGFFQHFRDGTLPVGVASAGLYIQLMFAAPELRDSWNIALHPGVYCEVRGEILRYVNGAADAMVVFESSNLKEEAFAYIDWWTSAAVQVEFAYTLQSTFGREFFWMTANVEAFQELPIRREHRETIVEMMGWIRETQRVPGFYMIERRLSDTFNAIILQGENSRVMITDALTQINREILRMATEFRFVQDGVLVHDYPIVTVELVTEWIHGR